MGGSGGACEVERGMVGWEGLGGACEVERGVVGCESGHVRWREGWWDGRVRVGLVQTRNISLTVRLNNLISYYLQCVCQVWTGRVLII